MTENDSTQLGESMTSKFVRVKADDPNRCQATHKDYQCPFRAVGNFDQVKQTWEGPKYCPRHGANNGQQREEAESQRNYMVAKWQARINQKSGSSKIKSLREEIGIMRLVLETKLQRCNDDTELLLAASSISEMTVKLGDLITTCHKIEKDTNQLMDRAQAITFIGELAAIIAMYVSDPDVIQAMSEDMLQKFDSLLSNE